MIKLQNPVFKVFSGNWKRPTFQPIKCEKASDLLKFGTLRKAMTSKAASLTGKKASIWAKKSQFIF